MDMGFLLAYFTTCFSFSISYFSLPCSGEFANNIFWGATTSHIAVMIYQLHSNILCRTIEDQEATVYMRRF